jgi:hypothetical protein
MPPDRAAHGGVEDFSGDCSRDAPGNCDEHAPNSSVPAAGVRAVARLCALGARAFAHGGRRLARCPYPCNATVLSKDPARRSQPAEGGPNTQNGPPSVAAANTNLPGRYPAGAPLGSPPPEHHPYLVSTRRAAQGWGKAPCRGALPLAKAGRGGPPHAFGSCAHGAAAGPLPRLRPTRRTRARQPTRLAVAATLRAVVAVHLRRLLPTLNGAGALQNHPAGRVPQHTLRGLAESGRRAESSQHDASPGW